MEFSIKIHRHPEDVIVAACDADLLGKTFRGDGLKIEVSESFYGGENVSEDGLRAALRTCQIANLVGEGAVAVAVAEGLADPDSVITIGGVKHVQVVRM